MDIFNSERIKAMQTGTVLQMMSTKTYTQQKMN